MATSVWFATTLWLAPAFASESTEDLSASAAEPAPAQLAAPPAKDSSGLDGEAGGAKPRSEAPWASPPPDTGGNDWLQTTSGEWVTGDLTRMRDRRFEFDSEEFDDIEIDLEDVAYFHFAKPHTYRFRGREVFLGTGQLRDGVITVHTTEGEIVERDAELLVSISRSAGGELDRWTVDLSVGLTARQGNTDQSDISGRADIERETAFTRFSTHYNGTWAKVDANKTANNHRLLSAFDFFLTWRTYLTLPFFEFFTDEFQNIDARYTPGVGLGYEILQSSRAEWDVVGGIGYQHTTFNSGSVSGNDAAIIFQTALELEVTKDLDWDNSYSLQLVATDIGKTNHHLESLLSFDIWGPVDFDVTFVWDRIESPQAEGDGNTPKSDDFRMTVGLGIDF